MPEMNDTQFNDACRVFYESGKLPWPTQLTHGDWLGWHRNGTEFLLTTHEAACINECELWNVLSGYAQKQGLYLHAWCDADGEHWCGEIEHHGVIKVEVEAPTKREMLLAAVRAVLAEEE